MASGAETIVGQRRSIVSQVTAGVIGVGKVSGDASDWSASGAGVVYEGGVGELIRLAFGLIAAAGQISRSGSSSPQFINKQLSPGVEAPGDSISWLRIFYTCIIPPADRSYRSKTIRGKGHPGNGPPSILHCNLAALGAWWKSSITD